MTFLNFAGRSLVGRAGPVGRSASWVLALGLFATPASAVVVDFGSGVVGGPIGVISINAGTLATFNLSTSNVGGGTGEVSLFDPTIAVNILADPDMVAFGRDENPNTFGGNGYIGVEDEGQLIGWDFGSPNSLILQEDNDAPGIPDDTGGGGTMIFTLAPGSGPVRLTRMSFMDDVDAIVSVAGLGIVGEIDIGATTPHCNTDPDFYGEANGDNCVAGLDFTGGNVLITSSFSVTFNGSGGVLGFEVVQPTAVPVPAGLPMLLAGLGGFAWLRRRARRGACAVLRLV